MKTSRCLDSFTLVEALIVVALVIVLAVSGGWAVVTHLRLGSHESGTVVALGKLQALFSELERDIRNARPRGDVPLLLDSAALAAIDFPDGQIALAELPKPIEQIVTTYPGADDSLGSALYIKKWTRSPRGWSHNRWPEKFRYSDNDNRGEPDCEPVAAQWYPQYEETFAMVRWPEQQPRREYFFIFRGCCWAVYTHYLSPTETRSAGAVWRYAPEQGVSCVCDRGVDQLDLLPSFEFSAHPGNKLIGLELMKSAVEVQLTVSEPDPGNAMAPRPLTLSRRVYPPFLQSAPYRARWVMRVP